MARIVSALHVGAKHHGLRVVQTFLRPHNLLPVYQLLNAAFESPESLPAKIRAEPELLDARTGLGETALHYLAVENQLRAVVSLVDAGAQINTLNDCGGTPLSDASSLGYVDLVEYLIAQGARLAVAGQSEPTLHEAVRGGHSDVVRLLLAAGAKIDEQNDLKETPLHLAAEDEDRLPVLQLLLAAGADATIVRIFNETPLDIALRSGAQACASALMGAGAPRGTDAA